MDKLFFLKYTSVLLVVELLLSACAHNVPKNSLWNNPNAIIAEIETKGIEIVLSNAYLDSIRWDSLLNGIATGKSAWLTVAKKLMGSRQEGPVEQIILSFGEAIGNNPESVLLLLKQENYSVNWICGQVDPERFENHKLASAELDKRLKALGQISDQSLISIRDKCVASVNSLKSSVGEDWPK